MKTPLPIIDPVDQIDLPGLQRRLDSLAVGQQLAIAIADYRRMFGVNDVGSHRLANFATGHGCATDATPSVVIFRKTRLTRS